MDAMIKSWHDEVGKFYRVHPLLGSLQGLTLQSMPIALHAGSPSSRPCHGVDAMIKSWHDEVEKFYRVHPLRRSLQGVTLQSMQIGLHAGSLS
ncbi:MAG: hypothetical protein AAFY05_22335, partial [Pseudomonadota bacterium]